jgi:hypothetical protein
MGSDGGASLPKRSAACQEEQQQIFFDQLKMPKIHGKKTRR